MALKSLVLVTAMFTVAISSTTSAQTLVQPGTSSVLSPTRPIGRATDNTDRMGMTKKPRNTFRIPTPSQLPKNWHLPAPREHGRR